MWQSSSGRVSLLPYRSRLMQKNFCGMRLASMRWVSLLLASLLLLPVVSSSLVAADEEATEAESDQWDVESAPGPSRKQTIDCDTGTWMNLDVSPDGRFIVFDLLGDIYEMPIDGADGSRATGGKFPKNLTKSVAWEMQPRYSPDGKRIAFASDRVGEQGKAGDNLWVFNRDGSDPVQVTQESYRLICHPVWHPDGQYLVGRKHFTSRRSLGAGEMWMFHVDAVKSGATAGIQLTKRPTDQKDVNEPVFSPDGRYLYYSEDVSSGDSFEYDKDSHQGIYAIKRLDLKERRTDTLIRGAGGACRPIASPDGKSLAFVRRVGVKTGLHLYDLQSGAVTLLHDDLERDMQEAWAIHGVYTAFDFTPDGESIVFWARGKIHRLDIQTKEVTEIPFRIRDQRKVQPAVRFPIAVGQDSFPVKMLRGVRVSPGGDQVAFNALGYIYVRELPDGKPRRLTTQTDHFEFNPSFSSDGKYVVYSTWDDQKLGTIRVASTGQDSQESWVVSHRPGHYITPVFSPDGTKVVYQRVGGGHLRSPLWSGDTGIYWVPVRPAGDQSPEPKLIRRSGASPQFGSGSDRVFLTRRSPEKESDNTTLFSVKLDGSDSQDHFISTWATDYAVSPDGNSIALIERFNVYLAPLLRTPEPIRIGPATKGLPVARVSQHAGDFIHFSHAGQQLNWSLGPKLYQCDVAGAMQQLMGGEKEAAERPVTETAIGFDHPHAKPETTVALIGGKIVTMDKQGVIENGTVLIEGNRIVAVGKKGAVSLPDDAMKIDLEGAVVLPGFVDTHAHGGQATSGITPQQNWVDLARLAFGVTTIHDPSNDTHSIFAASEMTKAGVITAPRTFSTGKILYGATGASHVEVNSLEDARFHLRRMKAVGAFTVKSYNQPRRDQRQQVLAAARELEMMVVPEGGSTFQHNMSMIVDGHTGIEHTLPVQVAYQDVMDLWKDTGVGYTPTLNVAYGGLSGEQYWYQIDDLWLHPRLQSFIPPQVLNPRSRRRQKSPLEDFNHIKVAGIAKQVVDQGGLVQAGGHGQLAGLCTHWEMWSFVQGGMTPEQALRCGTLLGAKYLGLDEDLGSVRQGKLADLVIIQKGADPMKDIRDSEKIQFVVANGNVYEANRMNRLGSGQPRPQFYWQSPGGNAAGVSGSAAFGQGVGCSCHRGRMQP